MDDILEQLRARAAGMIREGFDTRAEIIENLAEQMADEHEGKFTRRDVARIVDTALLDYYAEQAEWTEPTDCDKLDTAFAEMEKRGLVARQNFTCCNTCARAEIWDQIAVAEEQRQVVGYVFDHMQDTERAVEGGSLLIKYDGIDDTSAVEVGERIVIALAETGLDASWSGSADDAVQVKLSDWRKRRVNELPMTDEAE